MSDKYPPYIQKSFEHFYTSIIWHKISVHTLRCQWSHIPTFHLEFVLHVLACTAILHFTGYSWKQRSASLRKQSRIFSCAPIGKHCVDRNVCDRGTPQFVLSVYCDFDQKKKKKGETGLLRINLCNWNPKSFFAKISLYLWCLFGHLIMNN